MEHFKKLNAINVSKHAEKKKDLTYLSWTWAWTAVKKEYPDAVYKICRFGDNDLPYVYDENTGYMVFTEVTIEGLTYPMWLPVMDGTNKAMKSIKYEYTTRYGEKTVEAATMFDVNKTIMRCLTKNLAMFGLGLYIYAGEDLPEAEKETDPKTKAPQKTIQKTEPEIKPISRRLGVTEVDDLWNGKIYSKKYVFIKESKIEPPTEQITKLKAHKKYKE